MRLGHQMAALSGDLETNGDTHDIAKGITVGMMGDSLPLAVLKSAKGFYLGTTDESGPVSRESVEYWVSEAAALKALRGTAGVDWTQRTEA